MSGQSVGTPGKLRVVMAQLDFLVGDIPGNTEKVIEATHRAEKELAADIVVFPELCLTGYPPEDLLLRPSMDLRIAGALEGWSLSLLALPLCWARRCGREDCCIMPPW